MSGKTISTILRHDNKQNSYKIALLRSINDVVMNFPDAVDQHRDIAIPLKLLADYWIAYYWSFADAHYPVYQGPRSVRNGQLRNDISFRPELTELRKQWVSLNPGANKPSDGFYLINEFRIKRKYQSYPINFRNLYKRANTKIRNALEQPIRYAGPGNWQVFEKPKPLRMYNRSEIIALPGAKENEKCLLVDSDLWKSFQELSLWIEALCIHEWSIFTDHVEQDRQQVTRGMVYTMLTDRPDNRRPLTWERNQIDILLMEGHRFECPWSGRIIQNGEKYDLDHIIPVSLYPLNEMWNLVPSDPSFNSFKKRDKLPSPEALVKARPRLIRTYDNYFVSKELSASIINDVANRFLKTQMKSPDSRDITDMVTNYVNILAESRNIARFSI